MIILISYIYIYMKGQNLLLEDIFKRVQASVKVIENKRWLYKTVYCFLMWVLGTFIRCGTRHKTILILAEPLGEFIVGYTQQCVPIYFVKNESLFLSASTV